MTVLAALRCSDFLRDFRGDTVHASTLTLLDELGLGERFTALPIRVEQQTTVACDGRNSTVRSAAGLRPKALAAPMDVLYFRLPRRASDPQGTQVRVTGDKIFPMFDRGEFWQGSLRCIGDAAHAMSPLGGVGINLAIQDAVAAARILTPPLQTGRVRPRDLARVQRRRKWPAQLTQNAQRAFQNRVLAARLESEDATAPPVLKITDSVSLVRHAIGRMISIGVRPEHLIT